MTALLVAMASPFKCLLYLLNVRAIRYKLGPERLTRLGNSNVLRLPVLSSIYVYLWSGHWEDLSALELELSLFRPVYSSKVKLFIMFFLIINI